MIAPYDVGLRRVKRDFEKFVKGVIDAYPEVRASLVEILDKDMVAMFNDITHSKGNWIRPDETSNNTNFYQKKQSKIIVNSNNAMDSAERNQ